MKTLTCIKKKGATRFVSILLLAWALNVLPALGQTTPSRPQLALQIGHSDAIRSLAFQPDGKAVVTASDDGTMRLWEVSTGRIKATLPATATDFKFSPDSRWLATDGEGEISIWNARTGEYHAAATGTGGLDSLAYSSDGNSLAMLSPGGGVGLWNLETRKQLTEFKVPSGEATHFKLSPDGKLLAIQSSEEGVLLWDLKTFRKIPEFKYPKAIDAEAGFVFSPDGKTIAISAGSKPNGLIHIWDVTRKREKTTLRFKLRDSHSGLPSDLAFSPDGKLLAVAHESFLRLWDVGNGVFKSAAKVDWQGSPLFSENGRFITAEGSVFQIRSDGSLGRVSLQSSDTTINFEFFLDGGRYVAAFEGTFPDGEPSKAYLWETATGKLIKEFQNVLDIARSPDGSAIAIAGGDRVVRFWDVKKNRVTSDLQGTDTPLFSAATSPDGSITATGGQDSKIRLWDRNSGHLRAVLNGHTAAVNGVCFTPDGRTLISGSSDKTVRLWDVANSNTIRVLRGHESPITAIFVSPDGKTLASCYSHSLEEDERFSELRLWDLTTGKQKVVTRQYYNYLTVSFSPDSRTMTILGMRPTPQGDGYTEIIAFWDVRAAKLKFTRNSQNGTGEFSPDGQTFFSNDMWIPLSRDTELWDTKSGRLKGQVPGSYQAISPDNTKIATLSLDFTDTHDMFSSPKHEIRISDTTTAKPITKFQPGFDPMKLAFSKDGRQLMATGWTGRNDDIEIWDVRIWEVKSGKVLQTYSGRTITPDQIQHLVQNFGLSPETESYFALKGAALSIYKPNFEYGEPAGRALATFISLPKAGEMIHARAKAITLGDKQGSLPDGEWFVTTPEGYFDCSANAAKYVLWNVNGELYSAERYWKKFRRPDMVQKVLRGEKISAPLMTNDDVPPEVRFISLQYGAVQNASTPSAQQFVTITLEARGQHDFNEDAIELLVNGRPLASEYSQPQSVEAVTVSGTTFSLEADEKQPITLGDKTITFGDKAITFGDKPASPPLSASPYKFAKRYSFRVPLPLGDANVSKTGFQNVSLRAVTYDTAQLGSERATIWLRNQRAQQIKGKLFALCVGLSTYRNGVQVANGQKLAAGKIANLKYPDDDAEAIAARLQRESGGLYESVQVHTLRDQEVTLANLQKEFLWLQESVRPGQIDTVIVFLSGHGISSESGEYSFPAYEFDPQNVRATSLSGAQLQHELGAKLSARSVFLLVDSCYSGALSTLTGTERGAATGDDLSFTIKDSGVYLLASSGALQTSLESNAWNHGAFTEAILNSLKAKVKDGVIHFDELTYLLPDELVKALRAAKLDERAMSPVVPMEGRYLEEPVTKAQP